MKGRGWHRARVQVPALVRAPAPAPSRVLVLAEARAVNTSKGLAGAQRVGIDGCGRRRVDVLGCGLIQGKSMGCVSVCVWFTFAGIGQEVPSKDLDKRELSSLFFTSSSSCSPSHSTGVRFPTTLFLLSERSTLYQDRGVSGCFQDKSEGFYSLGETCEHFREVLRQLSHLLLFFENLSNKTMFLKEEKATSDTKNTAQLLL